MVRLFIPLKNGNPDDTTDHLEKLFVERRFGRSPNFFIYDTETQEARILPNTNHHFGGLDSPVSIAKKNGSQVVLAAHMGFGPYNRFVKRNIKIYQIDDKLPIAEQITLFERGQLNEMSPVAKGTCCSGKH